MDVEEQLRETDFSKFSSIKESLLEKILSTAGSVRSIDNEDELELEDLEEISAARAEYLRERGGK